ncbi:AI-2E family transporter [Spongisporangium articulatum]|uniref:AI-2E family transporter n=1 Tax=Spongisporangium articulatum TaxID=3362603 RepID=A0ABW8AQG9_9ACTN
MTTGSEVSAERPVRVPWLLRATAAWSWRLLLVGIMLYLFGRGFTIFQVLVVPVLIALLIVALVKPIHERLAGGDDAPQWRNTTAAVGTIVITLAIIAGLMTLIGQQIATGFPNLQKQAAAGLTDLQQRLADSPLHLTADQISAYTDQFSNALQGNSSTLVSGALQVTSTAGHVATGFFLVLFSSYFFLSGGRQIWEFLVGMFPPANRPRVTGAALRAWATLTAFIRATLVVALVDGVGVGVGAAIIGVPLAVPLGVLVFLAAFVPIVGALVSGAVAVLVALVAVGVVKAVIMLGVVILVQQVEAHLLQPFLLGRAVQLHPLAVILVIGAGVLLAGIVGALFAVPLLAVVNSVTRYLLGDDGEGSGEVEPDDEEVGPLADIPDGEAPEAEPVSSS